MVNAIEKRYQLISYYVFALLNSGVIMLPIMPCTWPNCSFSLRPSDQAWLLFSSRR